MHQKLMNLLLKNQKKRKSKGTYGLSAWTISLEMSQYNPPKQFQKPIKENHINSRSQRLSMEENMR